jgi:nicotinamide-nucleotide amidase
LGPTADDLTKPAIAELFGRPLVLDDGVMAEIEARFRGMGRTGQIPPGNRQQALIPAGARVLHNDFGTAPGIWLEDERGRWVAMLPGVPREMRGMTAAVLLPALRQKAGSNSGVVRSRTIRTTGIGESALAELLGELAREAAGLPLAFNPRWQGTDLRVTVHDMPPDQADSLLATAADLLRSRCARFVYGEDEADLADVVLSALRSANLRLATAESCTGGLLGARITAIPGSSESYLGGTIAYHNEVKVRDLGVPAALIDEHGAVSEEVAVAMAEGAAARYGADVGVSITGVAGPGGGSPEKPVGTVWIAAHWRPRRLTRTRLSRFVGDREEIRLRATQGALELIWRGAE